MTDMHEVDLVYVDEFWKGWPFVKFNPKQNKPDGGTALRNYKIREKRYYLQKRVIDIIRGISQNLADGHADSSINDTLIQEILTQIEDKQSGYALKQSRNFFVQGLDKGKRQGLWKVNIPAPICTVRRKSALFQPESFARLPHIRRIQNVLNESLSSPSFYLVEEPYLSRIKNIKDFNGDSYKKQVRAGQIVVSAIMNGGLLDTKAAYLLLSHFTKIQGSEDFSWVDIIALVPAEIEAEDNRSADEKGKRKRDVEILLRRWFPDALTELLLLRWQSDELGELPKFPVQTKALENYCNQLLRLFWTAVGLEVSDQCTASELIKMATTACALEIPPFLINYAQGKLRTSSLPVEAWFRFYRGMVSFL